jgi:hypothetical protein
MSRFVAALDPIGRLAEASPGFVWRLTSEQGHGATVLADGVTTIVVNLSVWESYEDLHAFVYRTVHGGFLRSRSHWFEATPGPTTALWWVAAGRRPSVEEALRRLQHLRSHGPTPQAFPVRTRFDPDGRPCRRPAARR